MKILLVASLGLLLLHAAPHHLHQECPCPAAVERGVWCDVCDVGYIAAVEVRSRYLFDVLDPHGHSLDLSTFECTSCRRAIATEGFCEEDRIGFVDQRVYFSRLSYELARGEIRDAGKIECSVCRRNAVSQGWCEACKLGMVGRVAIHDREAYRQLSEAIRMLRLANEAAERCEHCAAALVTNTECPVCRISYQDGRATLPAPRSRGR